MAKHQQQLQETKVHKKELSGESSDLIWDVRDRQFVVTSAAHELQQAEDKKFFAVSDDIDNLSL